MKIDINSILGVALGIASMLGYFVRPFADKMGKKTGYQIRGYTLDLMQKDIWMVEMATKAFLFAEKAFPQGASSQLFDAAVEWFCSQVPGPSKDTVRIFLQGVYDGLKGYPRVTGDKKCQSAS